MKNENDGVVDGEGRDKEVQSPMPIRRRCAMARQEVQSHPRVSEPNTCWTCLDGGGQENESLPAKTHKLDRRRVRKICNFCEGFWFSVFEPGLWRDRSENKNVNYNNPEIPLSLFPGDRLRPVLHGMAWLI